MLVIASRVLKRLQWDILSQIYDETWGEICVESQKSKPFRGVIGSIKGGILSVQILKLYIPILLQMLEKAYFKSGVNFRLRRIRVGQIGVADNIYAWCSKKMKLMLKICQAWSDISRTTFSPDKSVIVIQRAQDDNKEYRDFCLNGQEIVKTAEHLGIPIEDNADNLKTLVNERMMKTRQAIHGSKVICSGGG